MLHKVIRSKSVSSPEGHSYSLQSMSLDTHQKKRHNRRNNNSFDSCIRPDEYLMNTSQNVNLIERRITSCLPI